MEENKPTTRPADFSANLLAEDLQGTCKTIQQQLPEGMLEEDLTDEDHAIIDNEIFLCDTCNWWFELGEMGSDGENCNNCCVEEEE